MTPRWRFPGMLLLTLCLVGAIGCARKPPPAPPPDRQLEQLNRAARDAFDAGNYTAAAAVYQRALERAQLRDDFSAITDARFNSAVSLLKQEKLAEAAEHLRAAKREFSRAGVKAPPEFALLEAAVLFREGKPDRAWEVTEEVLDDGRSTPEMLGRTYYLRGRIAAERGDPAGVRTAIDALGRPADPRLTADLEDLKGRLALSEQRWYAAVSAFDRAAELWRLHLNYPAMTEALAMGARASEGGQRPALAADRYLQAGRSAALQGYPDRARIWLTRAAKLALQAGDDATAEEARSILAEQEDAPR